MNNEHYELLKNGIGRDIDTRKRRYDKMRAGIDQHPYGLEGYIATAFRVDKIFAIKKVVFNNPATIVYWEDGSKTVVKADNEPFDPEKGLTMAITKKALGNQGNYYNQIKKWLAPDKEVDDNGQK